MKLNQIRDLLTEAANPNTREGRISEIQSQFRNAVLGVWNPSDYIGDEVDWSQVFNQ